MTFSQMVKRGDRSPRGLTRDSEVSNDHNYLVFCDYGIPSIAIGRSYRIGAGIVPRWLDWAEKGKTAVSDL
jgi:hypothetical protein